MNGNISLYSDLIILRAEGLLQCISVDKGYPEGGNPLISYNKQPRSMGRWKLSVLTLNLVRSSTPLSESQGVNFTKNLTKTQGAALLKIPPGTGAPGRGRGGAPGSGGDYI